MPRPAFLTVSVTATVSPAFAVDGAVTAETTRSGPIRIVVYLVLLLSVVSVTVFESSALAIKYQRPGVMLGTVMVVVPALTSPAASGPTLWVIGERISVP